VWISAGERGPNRLSTSEPLDIASVRFYILDDLLVALLVEWQKQHLAPPFIATFQVDLGYPVPELSPLWILLQLSVKEVDDNWSYKTCKAPVKSSSTNQHPAFTGRMSFLSLNQQCQNTQGCKV